MTDGSVHRAARRLTAAGGEALDEIVAEEVAVALVYNGISHAVMMATPCDLEDFARGFSLTERIVEKPSEIYDIEVEPVERGIEVRLDIAAQRMARLQERRRSLAGRTGCGLCGVDSLDEAMRPVATSQATETVTRQAIWRAMPNKSRRGFLEHARPWWDIHRHRMAPEVEAKIRALQESGQLRILAGHSLEVDAKRDGAGVSIRPRASEALVRLEVSRIVSCRGLTSDPRRSANPLVAQLVAEGYARADPDSRSTLCVSPRSRKRPRHECLPPRYR